MGMIASRFGSRFRPPILKFSLLRPGFLIMATILLSRFPNMRISD